jgi:hypothetical protein
VRSCSIWPGRKKGILTLATQTITLIERMRNTARDRTGVTRLIGLPFVRRRGMLVHTANPIAKLHSTLKPQRRWVPVVATGLVWGVMIRVNL